MQPTHISLFITFYFDPFPGTSIVDNKTDGMNETLRQKQNIATETGLEPTTN